MRKVDVESVAIAGKDGVRSKRIFFDNVAIEEGFELALPRFAKAVFVVITVFPLVSSHCREMTKETCHPFQRRFLGVEFDVVFSLEATPV